MVWVTIPDEEIEPEKPLTSILLHKLRDNPEAIAAGLAGAPKILTAAYNALSVTTAALANLGVTVGKVANSSLTHAKMSTATGTVSTTSDNPTPFVNPGGKTAFTPSFRQSNVSQAECEISFMNASWQGTTVSVPWINFIKASGVGVTLFSDHMYILALLPLYGWYYKQVNIADPAYISTWFSNLGLHEISGTKETIPHPFDAAQVPGEWKTEVVPISAPLMNILKIQTIPLVGGGYLTPDIWASDPTIPIDPNRPPRSINEVIAENYNLAPGGEWPTEELFIKFHPLDPTMVLVETIPNPIGVDVCQLVEI